MVRSNLFRLSIVIHKISVLCYGEIQLISRDRKPNRNVKSETYISSFNELLKRHSNKEGPSPFAYLRPGGELKEASSSLFRDLDERISKYFL